MNPGPSRGSSLRYRFATDAPHTYQDIYIYILICVWSVRGDIYILICVWSVRGEAVT